VIKVSEIIDWHMSQNTETAEKINAFLEERKKELELATAEREKAFKKAGKKAKELEEKIGPANTHMYDFVPENLWIDAIK